MEFRSTIDIKTAREALDNDLAKPTLAENYCVEQAYNELNKKGNEHINLFIARNCKQETNKLLLEAMSIFTNGRWGASPFHRNQVYMGIHIDYEKYIFEFVNRRWC
ncbi:hypothetical protein [Buttiauxella ferragutiae]|nr:hypothetical protein [Buttiauxella ferragutiae]